MRERMTTLLTGGTGLLGAHLVRALNARGIRPRVLVRERSDRRGLEGTEHELAQGDVLDAHAVEKAMRGVDAVFHLAATTRQDPAFALALERVNVEGTRNVVHAARLVRARRLVHVSSLAAVGHGTLEDPATEDTPFNFEGNLPYHQSKRRGEALALAASGDALEVVVANPGYLLGAYDVKPSSGELLLLVARGLLPFYPSGGNNFVNAADVAEGLCLLMERGRAKERYILGGENLTYRELLTQCAEEAGVRPPALPAPRRLLERAARVADVLGYLSPERMRNLSTSVVTMMSLTAYASSAKASRELGYRARPVRLGIRDAYRWFQDQGALPRDHALAPRYG